MGDELTLLFEIVEDDAEPETIERAVRGLRRDLIEIDSVSTEQVGGPDQPGAKGDIGLLGTIAVSMTSAAVPAVITLLGRWLQDRRRCVLRISKEDGTVLEVPHTLDPPPDRPNRRLPPHAMTTPPRRLGIVVATTEYDDRLVGYDG